eukprot:PRCOL_00003899-RA
MRRTRSLQKAKECVDAGVSPGAGLGLSAEEQADAAFADLILTSSDGDAGALEAGELEELASGGKMAGAQEKGGIWGLLGALSGGAHIVRRKDGSI